MCSILGLDRDICPHTPNLEVCESLTCPDCPALQSTTDQIQTPLIVTEAIDFSVWDQLSNLQQLLVSIVYIVKFAYTVLLRLPLIESRGCISREARKLASLQIHRAYYPKYGRLVMAVAY